MAQTTGSMNGADGKLEIRVNGAGSFVDISGSSNSIETVTLTRINGKAYTLTGSYPLLSFGKYEGAEIKVNIIYSEVTGEGYMTLLGAWESDHTVELKWTPSGATVGGDSYTTAVGKIIDADLPVINAEADKPIMCSFTVMVPNVTHST